MKPILTAATLALSAMPLATPLHAQKGYLFKQPQVTATFRFGAAAPQASDGIFNFFTEELTIDRKDFQSLAWGADLSARLTSRVDLVIGVASSKSETKSEFRDFVDQDDLPIEQTTRLRRTPISVSGKFHFRERGTKLGEYAWVPVGLQPYVGAGVGVMMYDLQQHGDFVDFETMDVFGDNFTSSGSAPLFQVQGGADWWVTPRVGLTAEGRYAWSSAMLKLDFRDWDSIDLRGFQLTTGLALRF